MSEFALGVIPARGGSRGIPGKNLRLLSGKPLIAHTISAATASSQLNDFLVTTDSPEIAAVAGEYFAPPTFLRPKELAGDASPTIDAVCHAVATYEALHKKQVDIVAVLQPTTPLRLPDDIDQALSRFRADVSADSLISAYDAESVHPAILYRCDTKGRAIAYDTEAAKITRRQDFEPVFVRNGAVYLARRNLVMTHRRLMGETPLLHVMSRERSINIDSPIDLEIAQFLFNSLASKETENHAETNDE